MGEADWGRQTGAPGMGPTGVTATHPDVPVGLTYEPAHPPSLWDDMEFGDPEMPPFMVLPEAKETPDIHASGSVGWAYS